MENLIIEYNHSNQSNIFSFFIYLDNVLSLHHIEFHSFREKIVIVNKHDILCICNKILECFKDSNTKMYSNFVFEKNTVFQQYEMDVNSKIIKFPFESKNIITKLLQKVKELL